LIKNSTLTPDRYNKIIVLRDHLKSWPWQLGMTIRAPNRLEKLTHDLLTKEISRPIMQFTRQNVAALHVIVPENKHDDISHHAHLLLLSKRPDILNAMSPEILRHLNATSSLAVITPDMLTDEDRAKGKGVSIDLQPFADERTCFYLAKNIIDGGIPSQFNPRLLSALKREI